MNMLDIINKKRHKEALCSEEIDYFVKGYTSGVIPDYQASALLMAICINGMNEEETVSLTKAMMNSGDVLSLNKIKGVKCDKHSTGGVGDKTTIVLAPMLAACGLKVAKMSGRGLGFTGGTIDKLESIPGFKTQLENNEFKNNLDTVGLALASQTKNIAPADKKLYALRDVSGTVESIPLIASSILSKKLACGADAIVLDVKCGSGAFMKTPADAEKLAETMIKIGDGMGRRICAVISDMSQPLGYAVGNALEVNEAVQALRGEGPTDLTQLCIELGSSLMCETGAAQNGRAQAEKLLSESIDSLSAYNKFIEFISAQGADASVFENGALLEIHAEKLNVKADKAGFVSEIDCEQIGMASLLAGAGREKKDDIIDANAGIHIYKKIGDYAEKGETLAVVYSNSKEKALSAASRLKDAYKFSDETHAKPKLIYKTLRRR